ncbi:hypothetical protein DL95DRAFT_410794 [Leptodontidium sp. 2 PMI_412]|nr:hypothetical protein DL95DRAFT_410794 [Leptodontidium sp. 2 PMI_412]
MGRFDQEIVWSVLSKYAAQPRNEDDRVILNTKRQRRCQCNCDDGNASRRNEHEDSDEENQTKIFSAVSSGVVSHDPQDGLENSRIPMKPDRIIGLSMNDRYRRYTESFFVELSHSPVRNFQLIYPFLVLEAKRENAAPGFRSVEAQTAFPIRRFLKIQDELKTASGIELDPLAWFFAFQGEEWRLYSAILDKNKSVKVFQLWHGNLESQDGALQVFQIVDFIWTWARDVYRPQIRRCLSGRVASRRELSPTSTNPFSRSQSVLSVLSVRSASRPVLDTMLEDETPAPEVADDGHQWSDPLNVSSLRPFHAVVRHSDFVLFSFRVLEIPDDLKSFHDLIDSLRYDEESRMMLLHALKARPNTQNREVLDGNKHAGVI